MQILTARKINERARRAFAAAAAILFAVCVFIASAPHHHLGDTPLFVGGSPSFSAEQNAAYTHADASPVTASCPLCDWLAAPSLPLVRCDVLSLPPRVPFLARQSAPAQTCATGITPHRAASRAPPFV